MPVRHPRLRRSRPHSSPMPWRLCVLPTLPCSPVILSAWPVHLSHWTHMCDGQSCPRGIGRTRACYIPRQLVYRVVQLLFELAGLSIFHLGGTIDSVWSKKFYVQVDDGRPSVL